MSVRKKKKMFGIKPIMCITTILMLNFIGISYGTWNDGIKLNLSVSTGYINPEFYLGDIREKTIKDNNSQITITISEDNSIMYINGWCYPTYDGNIFVDVINKGSIPVILEDIVKEKDSEVVEKLDILNNFIEASGREKFRINMKVSNEDNEKDSDAEMENMELVKDYEFEYTLKFIQGVQ